VVGTQSPFTGGIGGPESRRPFPRCGIAVDHGPPSRECLHLLKKGGSDNGDEGHLLHV